MLRSFIKYAFLTYYYYYYYCCRDKNGDVDPNVVRVIVLSRVMIELRNCGVH